jgi:ABC-type Fe3+ transport system permease subunit
LAKGDRCLREHRKESRPPYARTNRQIPDRGAPLRRRGWFVLAISIVLVIILFVIAYVVDVAVEVNGNPWRLDLDWRWLRRGLELGCTFAINPDAHATGEIASSTRWGVAIARKAAVPANRVVNALDRDGFAPWLRRRREKTNKPMPRTTRRLQSA